MNGQTLWYWRHENPSEMHESLSNSAKVTVWCGVTSSTVIGPYIVRKTTWSCKSKCWMFRSMLENFLASELRRVNMQNLWFQRGLGPIQPGFTRIRCGTFFLFLDSVIYFDHQSLRTWWPLTYLRKISESLVFCRRVFQRLMTRVLDARKHPGRHV